MRGWRYKEDDDAKDDDIKDDNIKDDDTDDDDAEDDDATDDDAEEQLMQQQKRERKKKLVQINSNYVVKVKFKTYIIASGTAKNTEPKIIVTKAIICAAFCVGI